VPNSSITAAGKDPNDFNQSDCASDQTRCIDNHLLPGGAGPQACFGAPDGKSASGRTNGDCISKCMLSSTVITELALFADNCPSGFECAPCSDVPGGC